MQIKAVLSTIALLVCANSVLAKPVASQEASSGTDLSGNYICTGHDFHDGDFKATLTMALDKKHSNNTHTAYTHKADAGVYGIYTGTAVSDGKSIAFSFNNQNAAVKDYGTSLGTVTEQGKKLQFSMYYYEPEYKGGSHGPETCVRQ